MALWSLYRLSNCLIGSVKKNHCELEYKVLVIPSIQTAASLSEGAAAEEAETRKHKINDPKCLELGWMYIAYPNYLYMYICTSANVTMHQLAKPEIEAATSL